MYKMYMFCERQHLSDHLISYQYTNVLDIYLEAEPYPQKPCNISLDSDKNLLKCLCFVDGDPID